MKILEFEDASNNWKQTSEVKTKWLTSAMLVRGPRATTVTWPGNSATFSTRKSAALIGDFWPLGFAWWVSPSPSNPWTKYAIRGFTRCPESKKWKVHASADNMRNHEAKDCLDSQNFGKKVQLPWRECFLNTQILLTSENTISYSKH